MVDSTPPVSPTSKPQDSSGDKGGSVNFQQAMDTLAISFPAQFESPAGTVNTNVLNGMLLVMENFANDVGGQMQADVYDDLVPDVHAFEESPTKQTADAVKKDFVKIGHDQPTMSKEEVGKVTTKWLLNAEGEVNNPESDQTTLEECFGMICTLADVVTGSGAYGTKADEAATKLVDDMYGFLQGDVDASTIDQDINTLLVAMKLSK